MTPAATSPHPDTAPPANPRRGQIPHAPADHRPATTQGRLARLWSERLRFDDFSSFLRALYSRVLWRKPRWPLPGRGGVAPFRIRGYPAPLFARLGTSDVRVLEDLLFFHEYDAVLKALSAPPRVVVDLGANIGVSLALWRHHFPDATIVAAEPDATNFDLLTRNTRALPAAERIIPQRVCVAGTPRTVTLDAPKGGEPWAIKMGQAQSPSGEHTGTNTVEAITMPQLLARAGVTGDVGLLKCDIEGAEEELFADCRAWIGRVHAMAVEVHGDYTPERFVADLDKAGEAGRFDALVTRVEPSVHVLLLTRPKGWTNPGTPA
jgi:FkbM family methyltransferase